MVWATLLLQFCCVQYVVYGSAAIGRSVAVASFWP